MPKRKKKEEGGEEAAPPAAKSSRSAPPLPPPFEPPPPRLETPDGRPFNLRICSWNVDGLRAWVRKGGLQWVKDEGPDILCLQETKCGAQALPPDICDLQALPHQYWASPTEKPGYSGVGLLAREQPLQVTYGIGVEEHDQEGRVLTAEFPSLFVVAAYVPNSGRGLIRLDYRERWDAAFRDYLTRLDSLKPVAVCGDLNVAHQELDLRNPKANRKTAGFTDRERNSFSKLLSAGFLDTFRHLNPSLPSAFTFWSYLGAARERNVGWRLDYFLWSQRAEAALCDSRIHQQVMGSDHCPISLYLAV